MTGAVLVKPTLSARRIESTLLSSRIEALQPEIALFSPADAAITDQLTSVANQLRVLACDEAARWPKYCSLL